MNKFFLQTFYIQIKKVKWQDFFELLKKLRILTVLVLIRKGKKIVKIVFNLPNHDLA